MIDRYKNVTMEDHSSESSQFRLVVRDEDGNLIWRNWGFEKDTAFMEKYLASHGIQRFQSAHILPYPVGGVHMYCVVLSETDSEQIEPCTINAPYTGYVVKNMEAAFELAEKYNVPLYDGGEQLLKGEFK